MTEWAQGTLRCRNARIVTDDAGVQWVTAEFDQDGIVEFIAPLVIPYLVASEELRQGLIERLREDLADPEQGAAALEFEADLLDILTPEQFQELISRRDYFSGLPSD